ncbi:hypothetical protein ACIBCA_36320 [Kitasatospora sp. NPDC051170]|uniref:hypothetical protein n=1 Tax=Kitasatospora sp. NPDC051170 TaxID=3364056 RepID=UPI0037BD2713
MIEHTPHRSGACPGWPCYAVPRPEAAARLQALLQPGPGGVQPHPRPPAETADALARPTRARRLTTRLRPHRRAGARIPAQAVAVLVTEAAPGR